MNDSNELVSDLINLIEIFNPYALMLLFLGGFLIWAVSTGLAHLSQRLMMQLPTRRFMILQMSTLLTFALYIFGTVALIVGVLQPPKEFLIAAGGAIAVALGFALKDVVASLVAGILLLFDRPFRVGDRVSFADNYGEIVSIGLRTVRLKTLEDDIVTIPNSRFITDVVSSANAGALDMMVVTDFHTALEQDIDEARHLIEEVIVTSRFAYLKKPVEFAIEEVVVGNRLAIRLRAKAYVFDVHYEKEFQSDLVTRVTRLFAQHDIQRPRLLEAADADAD